MKFPQRKVRANELHLLCAVTPPDFYCALKQEAVTKTCRKPTTQGRSRAGPHRPDSPPQRPSRPIHRPEIYATQKLEEEMASVPLQIKAEPNVLARETSFSRSTSMPQHVSYQNESPTEVPWESVTLNRCLFIAITILVLTSGFQRLHEALHGQKAPLDEDERQIMRRYGALRHRTEPETTLWEVLLSWLPDLDDEEDDDEVKLRKRKPKKRRVVKTLRNLRNRPLPDKLLRQKEDNSS